MASTLEILKPAPPNHINRFISIRRRKTKIGLQFIFFSGEKSNRGSHYWSLHKILNLNLFNILTAVTQTCPNCSVKKTRKDGGFASGNILRHDVKKQRQFCRPQYISLNDKYYFLLKFHCLFRSSDSHATLASPSLNIQEIDNTFNIPWVSLQP